MLKKCSILGDLTVVFGDLSCSVNCGLLETNNNNSVVLRELCCMDFLHCSIVHGVKDLAFEQGTRAWGEIWDVWDIAELADAKDHKIHLIHLQKNSSTQKIFLVMDDLIYR